MKIKNTIILLIVIVTIGILISFIYFTTLEALKPNAEKIIKHILNLKKDDGGFGNANEKSDILTTYYATSALKNLNALDDNNRKSVKDYLLNELDRILNSDFNKNEVLNISAIILNLEIINEKKDLNKDSIINYFEKDEISYKKSYVVFTYWLLEKLDKLNKEKVKDYFMKIYDGERFKKDDVDELRLSDITSTYYSMMVVDYLDDEYVDRTVNKDNVDNFFRTNLENASIFETYCIAQYLKAYNLTNTDDVGKIKNNLNKWNEEGLLCSIKYCPNNLSNFIFNQFLYLEILHSMNEL